MIPFNLPYISGEEEQYIKEAIQKKNLAGDGFFTKKCQQFIEKFTKSPQVLLTSSCTHALELSALLCNIQPGDEVIMPSFTFVSSANAFVLRGAKIIFVDIRPDTMNIDEKLIEAAITKKTKAILVMHYAGVACAMNEIMQIANKHEVFVIEDAAQCMDAYYHGKHLGTIGHFGAFSFHSTKNIHCGEGGALMVNDVNFIDRAEIIREKGTNRKSFLRKEVDKYSWVDIGSSYLMSELSAAFLYSQLLKLKSVTNKRKIIWNYYQTFFLSSSLNYNIIIPKNCNHNAHIFYFKCKNKESRKIKITNLQDRNVHASFHYIPLHSSVAGKRFGIFNGNDRYTTVESKKLLRLPLYSELDTESVKKIVNILSY